MTDVALTAEKMDAPSRRLMRKWQQNLLSHPIASTHFRLPEQQGKESGLGKNISAIRQPLSIIIEKA